MVSVREVEDRPNQDRLGDFHSSRNDHAALVAHGVCDYERRALYDDYRLSALLQIMTPVWPKPVIVMNSPKDIKAFYMRLNGDGRADRPGDVSSALACGSLIATSLFPLKATLFGDLQRITGGLFTEMALVMPRTGRRADYWFARCREATFR